MIGRASMIMPIDDHAESADIDHSDDRLFRCLSTEEVLRILQEICKRGKDNVKVQANILNLRSVENYLSMLDETPLLRQVLST